MALCYSYCDSSLDWLSSTKGGSGKSVYVKDNLEWLAKWLAYQSIVVLYNNIVGILRCVCLCACA